MAPNRYTILQKHLLKLNNATVTTINIFFYPFQCSAFTAEYYHRKDHCFRYSGIAVLEMFLSFLTWLNLSFPSSLGLISLLFLQHIVHFTLLLKLFNPVPKGKKTHLLHFFIINCEITKHGVNITFVFSVFNITTYLFIFIFLTLIISSSNLFTFS